MKDFEVANDMDLPGTEETPPPPTELFEDLRRRRGENCRPRTIHLRPDGSAKYTNRLFLETSPYLLQHAHNPVNWFPWGREAFELARQLTRPLLISIGYATCHWCHVMEEESFENEEIALFLNQNFIAIKVDREERPDIDTVYMSALHATGAQGGWPLNVFATPDKRPFYGCTYLPPGDHTRGIGFLSLLKLLRETYYNSPERVIRSGSQLTQAVRELLTPAESETSLQPNSLELAIQAYRRRFDTVNGGLSGSPKFPSSLPVRLLLRQYLANGDEDLFSMAVLTLQHMADGGIYDQVAGGFHRYATDERWLIPHFEKMLYDNALLAITYLEGYQLTGKMEFALVVREILNYLQRELASPEGAFYAAADADSLSVNGQREEGFFFTWTPEEILKSLGRKPAEIFAASFGVNEQGNFEGRSLPYRAKTTREVAREFGLTNDEVRATVEGARKILYQVRNRRPLPLRDEKILVSWNALAISAFARAGLVLNDPGAVDQAQVTARFILQNMMADGRLAHSHQEGEAKGEGFLDDYAFLIAGLIDLFEVTGEANWLKSAQELTAVVQEEFEDRLSGGFFMTGPHHEELIAKEKPAYDGVVPSGNSVMLMNLLRLHWLTDNSRYRDEADRVLAAFTSRIASAPAALSEMLLALDFLQDTPKQVVIVAPRGNRQAAQGLVDTFRRVFLPNRTAIIICEGEELDQAGLLAPILKGKRANGDLAVAYLCVNRSCSLPTSDPEEFGRQLKECTGRR